MIMDKFLKNKDIVVTRDALQSKTLIQKIESLGGLAIVFPTIKISESADWADCDKALQNIEKYTWIVFTSINSVRYFFKRAAKIGLSEFVIQIAAIGQRTVDEIKRYGHNVKLAPSRFTATELLKAFDEFELTKQRILMPLSSIAREELSEGLKVKGALVDRVVVYQTKPNNSLDAGKMSAAIRQGRIDCLTFFSPSAFKYFCNILGEDILHIIKTTRIAIAAIGPTTAKAIEKMGFDVSIMPEQNVEDSLINALSDYYKKH